ncbi:MAG: aminotransferase class V-fold PLP-dependent enzyme [Ignavibacteriaceae bacterium]|nr:aminotransferase class V-fold PLP-dependent enzyme [Ignavibacteriaceae bacterium]
MTINETRELFPHIKEGKIYFNHASTGPFSTRVLSVLDKQIKEKTIGEIDGYENFVTTTEETKSLLGSMINCVPDNIAFTDNTSNSINILAQGLTWNDGDEIILNDLEFPANVYPFLNLKDKGVNVKIVSSKDGIIEAEKLMEAVTEKTKLISVSYVQFLTGYRIDLEKLGAFCEEKNILLCVDAIQGLGAIKLDVQKCKINFLACGTQKWLLGIMGLSFIYVDDNLLQKIKPVYAGWLSVENAWNLLDYNLTYRPNAERFQPGTLNAFGIYILNASLNIFHEFGLNEVEKSVLSNSTYFIKILADLGFEPILKDVNKDNIAGIVSFKHQKANQIFKTLKDKDIHCAVREGMVRFAPHFYNTKDDIDVVADHLKNLK